MDEDELIKGILDGTVKLHQVEDHTDAESHRATELRRKAMEKISGAELSHISKYSIDANKAMNTNIENMIGAIQMPLGVAGPLSVNGEFARGKYYIPLATTEGALVASVNRGCSTLTKSGGVTTTILRDAITRAPVLRVPSARHAQMVINYIAENFEKIKIVAEHGEPFLKLLKITPYVVGRSLFLRFFYNTGDAMGMNMVTFGTDQALDVLQKEFTFLDYIALSGNMCIDKKPSALNFIEGRGKTVIAEAVIPAEIVRDMLKTTPDDIVEVSYRKNLIGSAQAGAYGFNAHIANVIASLFIATGQDEAHVVEGSHGFTTCEKMAEDLHVAVTLPAIQVGTIGGGTRVETQQECLKLLGVAGGGKNNSKAFAEIVASACLAGEISLIAALAARHLSRAHKAHGR
ncbi:MAG: hydroxymethylglutaryl-CoA reductase (NADPH) [Candidatus Altiarchaeota archaeon]